MTEKVKISQEQFDWLERYKSDEEIDYAIDIQLYKKRPDSPVADWKPSEVARALYIGYEIKPEPLKVGDWATRKKSRRIIKRPSDREGVAFQIEEISSLGAVGSDGNGHVLRSLRHATPDEIAEGQERQKWAEINREVGEIREGDIGIARNGMHLSDEFDIKSFHRNGDLIGFYPAESFISFEDGEAE